MGKTYSEKLLDPRWQKKRLKIFERDGFACLECGDSRSTLNVHHGCYLPGCDPWEYADHLLHTLCEPCHERTQHALAEMHAMLGGLRIEGLATAVSLLMASGLCSLEEPEAHRVETKSIPEHLENVDRDIETLERYGDKKDPKAMSRLMNLRQLVVVLREELGKGATV